MPVAPIVCAGVASAITENSGLISIKGNLPQPRTSHVAGVLDGWVALMPRTCQPCGRRCNSQYSA
jgi:hypothetical protein